MSISFEGTANQAGFYQLFNLKGNFSEKFVPYSFWAYYNISDPILLSESLIEYQPSTFIFSDRLAKENKFNIELLGYMGYDNYNPRPADLVLRSISEDFFIYLKSWYVHNYNQNNQEHVDIIEDLDPYRIFFQEQPSDLYSNIHGGLGIFAGFTEIRKSYTINND